jgi:hypothetical protein
MALHAAGICATGISKQEWIGRSTVYKLLNESEIKKSEGCH